MTLPKFVKKISTKEAIVPKEGQHIIFPCANGSVIFARKGSGVRPSGRSRQDTEEGQEHAVIFKKKRRHQILQNNNKNKMTCKKRVISGTFMYRHDVQERQTPYLPQESSFPIPLKYIDVVRRTNTAFGRIAGKSN